MQPPTNETAATEPGDAQARPSAQKIGSTTTLMGGIELVVEAGPEQGSTMVLPPYCVIGRSIASPWNLGGDPRLSRQHARFVTDSDGTLLVEDLQSTNGTYVNGRRIVEPTKAAVDDTVTVGNTTLRVTSTALSPVPQPTCVFISYRREDSGEAQALCDRLREHLGVDRVFWDRDIDGGVSYLAFLRQKIRCSVTIALIGRNWHRTHPEVGYAIKLTDDNVRTELAAAFEFRAPIIPVVIDSHMPMVDDLPPELTPFAHINAVELRHGNDDWAFDLAHLVRLLSGHLAQPT